MFCTTCNSDVGGCTCPTRDADLKALAMDPSAHIVFKWCRRCDKHYARCRCETPEFYILSGGKEVDPTTLRNVLGQRVEPDLTQR